MQLISLGVYDNEGRRSDVNFRPGKLNILTGQSKTGKSAVLHIAEYCLGRDQFTVPSGVITSTASWFYVLVEFRSESLIERVLICRPRPDGASTNQAMLAVGGVELEPPSYQQLKVDSDTDVIKHVLSTRLGIERFKIEPSDRSLRNQFEVSVRQALWFCFQNQNEIASQDILFHRQSDPNIKSTIKDVLPYFIGAATPEYATVRRQYIEARRALRRTSLKIEQLDDVAEIQTSRISQIVQSAINLGILSEGKTVADFGGAEKALSLINQYNRASSEITQDDGGTNFELHESLSREATSLRMRLRSLDEQVEALRSTQRDQSAMQEEVQYQISRLSVLEVLAPTPDESIDSSKTCPLCNQVLPHADETLEELHNLLTVLRQRFARTNSTGLLREESIESLVDIRNSVLSELQETIVRLESLAKDDEAISNNKAHAERIAFLQGRASQEIEQGVHSDEDLTALAARELRHKKQLARFESRLEEIDPKVAMRVASDHIGDLMTDYARELRLEDSEHLARIDFNELSVIIQKPGTRTPLSRMGSAENWVGYHLAAHLALHHWFVEQSRPVPRFIFFDQPTQAFFPEEVVDSTKSENADWEAVRRQFTLMFNVVSALNGELQVIVCDHANLADDWFQDAVIANWRHGVALIPSDWYEPSDLT